MDWAVLLMAYGGPDSLEDVEPYLLDVRGGRETPPALVEEIKERYARIGGKSPLLSLTRAQASALEAHLNNTAKKGNRYQVFVGMRHWAPYIREAVAEIRAAGLQHIAALSMTPFASKMSTGAYREKLNRALEETGGSAGIDIRVVECWYENKAFIQAAAGKVLDALQRFPDDVRHQVPVLFTAHSLPAAIMQQGDPYADQFQHTTRLVAEACGLEPMRWRVGYQSAGAQSTRWLGPSLTEMLDEAASFGEKHVLVAPVGFIADHVEVLFDIDIEAKEHAHHLGIHLERTDSQNDSAEFIQALANVVEQKISE